MPFEAQTNAFKEKEVELKSRKKPLLEKDDHDGGGGVHNLTNKTQKLEFLQQQVNNMMKVPYWKPNDTRNVRIHKAFLKFMRWYLQPLHIGDCPWFIQMMNECVPTLNVGSRSH